MAQEKFGEFNQVYVWELPVRLLHWMNVVCIFVLVVTGFLIANPPVLQSSREASFQYGFGRVRFIHFAAAYIFVFSFLGRMYWGFVGNQFVRWRSFLPLTHRKWREAWKIICLDVFMICKLPVESIASNALAAMIYSLVFLVMLFQIVSGFALYAAMSPGWFPRLFAWITPLFGGESSLRQWHHLASWFFIIFVMGHVYLSFYHDYLEGRGTISSMVGGWKFIERPGNGGNRRAS
ncbi:MAG: Ni/Fe-hydrogenase, b-type cytochrome subunit [Candidatus Aminicenantales bacterium]